MGWLLRLSFQRCGANEISKSTQHHALKVFSLFLTMLNIFSADVSEELTVFSLYLDVVSILTGYWIVVYSGSKVFFKMFWLFS